MAESFLAAFENERVHPHPAGTATAIVSIDRTFATIHDVAIHDSTAGPAAKSTTSTWNSISHRELTSNNCPENPGASFRSHADWRISSPMGSAGNLDEFSSIRRIVLYVRIALFDE
jgi:hypothetical protein